MGKKKLSGGKNKGGFENEYNKKYSLYRIIKIKKGYCFLYTVYVFIYY